MKKQNKIDPIKKHYDLVNRLIEVQKVLKLYSRWTNIHLHNKIHILTPEQLAEVRKKIDSFNWNDWHTLENRLEKRILKNISRIKVIEFDLNGFTTI